MKRKIKRIQAVCIYMMLLLLLLLPQTAMAKNTEKSKTTFPVQVIHKPYRRQRQMCIRDRDW